MRLNEFLGLLDGDGCLKKRVSFANCNPKIVHDVCLKFKRFSNKEVKAYINTYWPKDVISDEGLIRYWKKYLPDKIKFYKIRRCIRTTRNLRKRETPKLHGTVELKIHNIKLTNKLLELLKTTKKQCLFNKHTAIGFLKGIIAAEGSVKLVDNKLRELRISSADLMEQNFLRNTLKNIGIEPSKAKYKFYIAISGLRNFKPIHKYKLFSLHPEKNEKFVQGFQNLIVNWPLRGE